MPQMIEFRMSNDGVILVEASTGESPTGEVEASASGAVIEKATRSFEEAIAKIGPLTETLITQVNELVKKPDEMGIELGVKLSAEGGLVIASAALEGQITIKLLWKRA